MTEDYSHNNLTPRFNLSKLFIGLLIIMVGIAYLMQEAGIGGVHVDLRWELLWPILVILTGLALLRPRGYFSLIIGLLVMMATLGLVALIIFSKTDDGASKTNTNRNVAEVVYWNSITR